MERAAGVLMHVSSLYGDYSIGSFGDEAKNFIDFLKDCGFKYWQVLPFCMVDECNSPYKSYSSFAGNPYFIDLKQLRNEGFLNEEEINSSRQKNPYNCEFECLKENRFKILYKASLRVKNKNEIENFINQNVYLEKFCHFMAKKESNKNKPWYEWATEEDDEKIVFAWKFIQYKFFEQWGKIKKYANENGVKIIGDIPFYVSYDSCDVWSNKKLFQLNDNNELKCVAGVPPDCFSEDGQMWGNPIYDWTEMEKDNFKWWSDRMKHMFSMFDVVRIDHFRAFDSYYSIPSNAASAKEGEWKKGPGKSLVDIIMEIKGEKGVIAEDLGGETEKGVKKLLEYSGFPGMRVFQFGFTGEKNSIHTPHNYDNNCFAYTGTHDNNTLLGYVWALDNENRARMLKYCGFNDDNWDKCYDSIIRTVFASNAGCVILPIQDLLGYGCDTRLNTPGKADGNWSYRITEEQLKQIDNNKYKELIELYSR